MDSLSKKNKKYIDRVFIVTFLKNAGLDDI